jgi:hypothetical protein
METYGVSLESFLKTAAGTVYADIHDKILPYLRKQESDCLGALDSQRRILKELDGFRNRLEFVRTELADLSQKAEGEICGRPFRKAVALRIKPEENDSKVDAACEAFARWSGNSVAATDGFAVHDACATNTEGVKCMKEFSAVFRMAIDFWNDAADIYICDYVFENAEMKFKIKICRDIIKAMPIIIRSGEAFLNRCDAQKFDFGKNHERVIEMAEEAVGGAKNRLGFYRKVRSMAEDSGIAAAFAEWRRSYEFSTRMAR